MLWQSMTLGHYFQSLGNGWWKSEVLSDTQTTFLQHFFTPRLEYFCPVGDLFIASPLTIRCDATLPGDPESIFQLDTRYDFKVENCAISLAHRWKNKLKTFLARFFIYPIWSEWWEDMTWPKNTYLPTYLCTSIREQPIGAIIGTFETLITILTIENLDSWQSLLPDN